MFFMGICMTLVLPWTIAQTILPSQQSLYECPLLTFSQSTQLMQLSQETNLDIWTHSLIMGQPVQVRVMNNAQKIQLLKIFDQECKLLNSNVQSWIASASPSISAWASTTPDFFSDYQSYDVIRNKLIEWTTIYPDLITFTPSLGKSFEGRDLYMIKITNSKFKGPKRAIWWNSGQHAREWIGPATVLYLAQQLLNSTDDQVLNFLNKAEFYITPLQNPDGYEYSRVKDRLWRKNRRRNDDGSYGVDLNRNWDEHWGQYGSSSRTKSDTYRGTAPFSEPETKYIADWIQTIPNRYAGIDFHSFGQLVLRNWGWTSVPSVNEPILKELGDGIRDAIYKQSGSSYTSEIGAGLYPASGCTDDWMSAKAQMVGYTIELRDTGKYGFVLPPNQIIPTGKEIWNAMRYFVDFVLTHDIPPNQVPVMAVQSL